jgi:hypothetical protein
MKKGLAVVVACLTAAGLVRIARAADKEGGKGKEVKYQVHSGHFVSNKAPLKGKSSFLAFTDYKAFRAVFGIGRVLGNKQKFVTAGDFKTQMVAAAIHRGNSIWTYTVEKVTAADGTLYLRFKAVPGKETSAQFASPLIVSVPKGKYTRVVFLENGKKAGTAKVKK